MKDWERKGGKWSVDESWARVEVRGPNGGCKKRLFSAASHSHPLLLSNVVDADHQNSCLFTNNGHFLYHLYVF